MNSFSSTRRRSLVSHVEDVLRQALIEGRLEPGTRLVTRELADKLGMSITPVREALVRFAASGILTAEPSQSFRVPVLDEAQYSEICEVRTAVEGLAAANAAVRISAIEIERMEELLSRCIAARSSGNSHLALTLNKEFRFVLYAASRMPTLLDVIELLWLKAGPGLSYLYGRELRSTLEYAMYDRLLVALRARDATSARRAIETAIAEGAEIVNEAIRQRMKTTTAA